MAKHGGSQITSRYTCAYAHTLGALYFLLSQVSHKLNNPLCKIHPTFGVMCLSKKKNNPILHLLVDYTVFISICKATKQAEILQESFSLIFYHLNNFYRTAMYKNGNAVHTTLPSIRKQ